MQKQKIIFFISFVFIFIALGTIFPLSIHANVFAQQPTGSIPTVTGTETGRIVRVRIDQSNELVRVLRCIRRLV
jgi:hypothetical protein